MMYIQELHYINVGPIERIDVALYDTNQGQPKPVVFVGKNGSGKSILISNIVDAFYEIAGKEYEDALHYKEAGGHLYYKTITPSQIRIGQREMYSLIKVLQSNEAYEYMFRYSRLSKEQYADKYGISVSNNLSWDTSIAQKTTTIPKENVADVFEDEVVCYFRPDRYTFPSWLGDAYNQPAHTIGLYKQGNYKGELKNAIEPPNSLELLQQWILDIVVDARPEIEITDGNQYGITYPNTEDLNALLASKANIELILSEILTERVLLRALNRSADERRLSIVRKSDMTMVAPDLESLSTGQLALINIFGSIIRYADTSNISKSSNLSSIKGVVVIDEVELHLHSQLQRDVLPKLISLFPAVQFIITSHSPLFLLGMHEHFGDDGFMVYEMPKATRITTEQFSEFDSAYRYFQTTNRYRSDIQHAVNEKTEKTLIVTEGATDWRHMKAAMIELSRTPGFSWLQNADFEFLEFDPPNKKHSELAKLHMSSSELIALCESYCKICQHRKIIAIADRDVPKDMLLLEGNPYKYWNNNVYSLCLPVPESRKETPGICIEHYYSDDVIKREVVVDGHPRRLYMGNEFDSRGRGHTNNKFCNNRGPCGKESIAIIDGNTNCVLYNAPGEDETNYALTKMMFAEKILAKEPPFNDIDFSNFKRLFSIIKDILDLELDR